MTRGVSILLVVSCGLLLAGVWWAVSRSGETRALAPDAHRAESAGREALSNGDGSSVRTAVAPIVVEGEGIAPGPVLGGAVVDPPARDDLRFCGRVLDREGRHPVAGARVRIGTRNGADCLSHNASGSMCAGSPTPTGASQPRVPPAGSGPDR